MLGNHINAEKYCRSVNSDRRAHRSDLFFRFQGYGSDTVNPIIEGQSDRSEGEHGYLQALMKDILTCREVLRAGVGQLDHKKSHPKQPQSSKLTSRVPAAKGGMCYSGGIVADGEMSDAASKKRRQH